jgi:acetyl-CoA carboxylase biotin carboxyl carrier protein
VPNSDLDPKINGSAAGYDVGASRPVRGSVQDLGKELAELARNLSGSLHRLSVRSGDCEIEVEWHAPPGGAAPATAGQAPAGAADGGSGGTGDGAEGTTAVRSPLVGTYFAAPAPTAEPFVRVGDEVERGQQLAIVEAMKMMNSVIAEEPGVVTEILVSNGQSVEFDQPLLLLRPDATDGSKAES